MSQVQLDTFVIWPYEQFKKDFTIIEPIGQGQYGEVFSAKPKATPQLTVAVKFLKCQKAAEKLRIRDEIDILTSLSHPNVLTLLAAYEEEHQFIQVLEYLSGGELFQRVIECADSLSEYDIAHHFIKQICQACSYLASKQVAHLDIKPENVVCTSPSKDSIVKLVDFGFARKLGSEEVKVMQGTPEFVSPEVINYEAISLRTDMWSVGVLAYVLLSGLSPFLGDTHQETYKNIQAQDYTLDEPEFDDVSEEAKNFISRLLVADQSQRMSADEALKHPWLTSCKSTELWRKATMTNTSSKLTLMMTRLKWQKCTNVIMACSKLKRALHTQ